MFLIYTDNGRVIINVLSFDNEDILAGNTTNMHYFRRALAILIVLKLYKAAVQTTFIHSYHFLCISSKYYIIIIIILILIILVGKYTKWPVVRTLRCAKYYIGMCIRNVLVSASCIYEDSEAKRLIIETGL